MHRRYAKKNIPIELLRALVTAAIGDRIAGVARTAAADRDFRPLFGEPDRRAGELPLRPRRAAARRSQSGIDRHRLFVQRHRLAARGGGAMAGADALGEVAQAGALSRRASAADQ